MSDYQLEIFPATEPATQIVFEQPRLDAHSRSVHETAIRRAKTYLVAEAALLESIIEIDRERTFEKFGETHLTPYCVKYLGLTSDVAANFVRVARKSHRVPELKEAISQGDLTVPKAKTIASVITSENKESWIAKAKTLSKEKLEQEVAKAAPQSAKPERAKAVRAETFRIEFEFTSEDMKMLRRAQDIVSQSLGHSASLAETHREALKIFLHYRDPLEKATRAQEKNRRVKEKQSSEDRSRDCSEIKHAQSRKKTRQYPAALVHALNLRDKCRCQARKPDGSICASTRWVQFHHIVEVENGGKDTLENMITLCSSHHRSWHRRKERL